jgi:hypothetical protein
MRILSFEPNDCLDERWLTYESASGFRVTIPGAAVGVVDPPGVAVGPGVLVSVWVGVTATVVLVGVGEDTTGVFVRVGVAAMAVFVRVGVAAAGVFVRVGVAGIAVAVDVRVAVGAAEVAVAVDVRGAVVAVAVDVRVAVGGAEVAVAVDVRVAVRVAVACAGGLLLAFPGKVNALISTILENPSPSESWFSIAFNAASSRPLLL